MKILFVLFFGFFLFSFKGLAQQGAFYTGEYRDMFQEVLGKTQAEVNQKVDAAFQQLFYGGANERLYYEVGQDMAYIYDVGAGDVRTEGMSYGMMICVQLDKQEEFDKLWRWAKTNMQQPPSSPFDGFFAWQCNTNGSIIEDAPAPDGEVYFVTALFFASHRWGDGSGIFNYSAEAQYILEKMLDKTGQGGVYNMFDEQTKLINFVPYYDSRLHTDPSYNVPAFFELWARWAETNTDFWEQTPEAARQLLRNASHPVSGLFADYSLFDGTPYRAPFNQDSDRFQVDAWRCAMNIGMDYLWFRSDPQQPIMMERYLNFFRDQGEGYLAQYDWDGSNPGGYHSTGLIACNAVASLAVDDENLTRPFLQEFWDVSIPTGQWRYYDGMLYMLSMLNITGNMRAWMPGGENPEVPDPDPTPDPDGNLLSNGEFDNGTTSWSMQYNNSTAGTFTVVNNADMSGINAAYICPTSPGDEHWNVQLRQEVGVSADTYYEVSFIAKADAPRTMSVALQMEGNPWDMYFEEEVDLTTQNTEFTLYFSSSTSDPTAVFKFFLGTNSTCVYIDNVVFKVIDEIPEPLVEITPMGDTEFCSGVNLDLQATIGNNYEYQWFLDGVPIAGAELPVYTVSESGLYSVRVLTQGLTINSDPVEVIVHQTPNTPEPYILSSSLCEGDSVQLFVDAESPFIYKWEGPLGFESDVQNPTRNNLTALMSGEYSVVFELNGCESEPGLLNVSVYENPPPPLVESPVTYSQYYNAEPLFAEGENLVWYETFDAIEGLAQAPIVNTSELGTSFYYVSQTIHSCESIRAEVEVIVEEAEVTQTIHLQQGWNLVSFSVFNEFDETSQNRVLSISSVFSNTTVEIIKDLNGFWNAHQAEQLNSLHTIEPGKGYLVYMNTEGIIEITGIPVETPNLGVSTTNLGVPTGWQLIGYPGCTDAWPCVSTPISNYFNTSNAETIKNFEGFWTPDGMLNSIENFEVGKGYFYKQN